VGATIACGCERIDVMERDRIQLLPFHKGLIEGADRRSVGRQAVVAATEVSQMFLQNGTAQHACGNEVSILA